MSSEIDAGNMIRWHCLPHSGRYTMQEFEPHDVEWTQEKIDNYWNYFVTNEQLLELSFAEENGREIIKLVRKYLNKDSMVLDYGCGGGALMGYLFENDIPCSGLDPSPDSLNTVKEKFKDNPLFKGVILSKGPPLTEIPDKSYDFIFCIETIEHLFPEKLPSVFKEFHRILKPGGYAFVSTPHNERLNKYKVICPDCGGIFHRVQHMNSFSVEKLTKLMSEAGFASVFCMGTFLLRTKSIIHRLKYAFNFLEAKLKGKKMFSPHLVYLGKK